MKHSQKMLSGRGTSAGKAAASRAAPTGHGSGRPRVSRGTLWQKRCVSLHCPAQASGSRGCVWAPRGRPAAQPWPLWSAAGIPTQPPAAHPPGAAVCPCYLCCCAHSIKENIETKRLTRQRSRGSQKPGPGAGKGCQLQNAPGRALRWPRAGLRGRGVAGRVWWERPSLWDSVKLLSEHLFPTAYCLRTLSVIFKAQILPNENSHAHLRSLGVHTFRLLRLNPSPLGSVTLFNSFFKPRHFPSKMRITGAPLGFWNDLHSGPLSVSPRNI